MDPVSQSLFGALWAQAGARRAQMRLAAVAGGAAAVAPDLDVLIRSPHDSLVAIEFHRHFTHALAFIPFGALVVSLLLWPLFRRHARFGALYLWCLLGFASHGLLDACTSYGTHLLWPFSDARVAWNVISVVDPLFTIPLAGFLSLALWQRRYSPAALGALWIGVYLSLGAIQQQRAEHTLGQWAADSGIRVQRLVAKPAFGNLILWRGLVDDGRNFHVVAIRNAPWSGPLVYPGPVVEAFDFSDFPPESVLARDLARFDRFSAGWLYRYARLEQDPRWFVADLRYSFDPAAMRPLWGVRFDPLQHDRGVDYEPNRDVGENELRRYYARLRGQWVDF